MGIYGVSQICLNGHCITDDANENPDRTANACNKCGAKTITACQKCGTSIRGHYYSDTPGFFLPYEVPAYCHKCGAPYPWTETKLRAAQELILEDENSSREEKDKLIEVLPALVVDMPQTKLAETRMKKFLAKAGSFVAEGVKSIIVEIASETIKKRI